jgi:AcrR family transcriptional regulator
MLRLESPGATTLRKDTLNTRKRIIETAETLFSERGVESTSLLEIAKAAGQKNRSAMQYHFKNKEGLLEAVLDKHALRISEKRAGMLDELERRGDYSLYELIEALVLPMASQLDNDDGGPAFLKIHSQLMTTEAFSGLRARRDENDPSTRRLLAMAAPFMNTGDPDMARSRLVLSGCLLIHGLAAYLAQGGHIERSRFLDILVQGIVDLLDPPARTIP